MRKLVLLFVASVFFFTLFSLSARVLADAICCCEGSCGFEPECSWMESCPDTHIHCTSYFCPWGICEDDPDCPAIDTDVDDDGTNDGIDKFTRGICYYRGCDATDLCDLTARLKDNCIGSTTVDEARPKTGAEANECERKPEDCDTGWECVEDEDGVGACVESGAKEGESCEEEDCISTLDCCDECKRCYDSCAEESGLPNAFCCAKDEHCPDDTPYCDLDINECQAECPAVFYPEKYTCTEAKDADNIYEIDCGTTTGCLFKTDDKYYKVKDSKDKEVTVTLKHIGNDYCNRNDLVIFDDECDYIGTSEKRFQPDSFKLETDSNIIVKVRGDCASTVCEDCQWELDIDCEEICEEKHQKCGGPITTIELRHIIAGPIGPKCLYAHSSKAYKILNSEDVKLKITVTQGGSSSCRNENALIIYDGCDTELARIENQTTKTWTGKATRKDMTIEIHSYSDDVDCQWTLEVKEISEECSEDGCAVLGGDSCNPYRCIDGECPNGDVPKVCDEDCFPVGGDENCEDDEECQEEDGYFGEWFCGSDCICKEGVEIKTELKKRWNMVAHPFEEFEVDTDCELCSHIYGSWDSEEDDYLEELDKLDEMIGGHGYWVCADDECDITFFGTRITDKIELKKRWNMIGTIEIEGNIETDCELCSHIYGSWDSEEDDYLEELDKLDEMIGGHGYWVCADDECEINRV